jgi:pimeloyl-ACP methyl ester carboxylesterase
MCGYPSIHLQKIFFLRSIAWSDDEPIPALWKAQLRSMFRHAAPPLPITGAGHFLQEDTGPEIAEHMQRWLQEYNHA